VSYDGKETYLNSRTYLLGHDGASAVEVPAGLHTYTFACEIPLPIPESAIGRYGDISYLAEAVLDIPWRFDKDIKTPFTIVRYDNLNNYPDLLMPLKMEEIKTFCCLFCKSGPCMMSVSIPCGGFSPGKTILVRVEYVNRSNTNVEHTKFKLIRTFSFTSSTPRTKTKRESETLVETIDGGVEKGKTANIETGIIIPSHVNNSNVRFCSVVEISYKLQVEGSVSGCHLDPAINIPITIGAIGVGEALTYSQGFPEQPMPMPTAPAVDLREYLIELFEFICAIILFAAPSFEEAVGKKDLEASMMNPNFSMGWNVPTNQVPSAPDFPGKI
jgi:hypothetical protein